MRVRLLGRAEVEREGGFQPLRSELLAVLAAHHPMALSRRSLCSLLWPGEDSAARLRVALSRLRESIPLQEDGDQVGLDGGLVTVDIADLRQQLGHAAVEPDPSQEWLDLSALLPALSLHFAFDSRLPWAEEAKAAWELESAQALARLADLAASRGSHQTALAAAEAGLVKLTDDDGLWSQKLLALAALGRGQEGVRAFYAASKRLKAEGSEFGQDLLDLAEEMLTHPSGQAGLTRAELASLGRFFRRACQDDQEAAVRVLASPAFRPECWLAPEETLPWLRQALSWELLNRKDLSLERERIHVRTITCLAYLEDFETTVALAEQFLSQEIGEARRRIALHNLSWALFHLGRWEEADAAVLQAEHMARQSAMDYDAWQHRGQWAAFQLLKGDFEAGREWLERGLAELRQIGILPDDEAAMIGNLALILLLERDWARAEQGFSQALGICRSAGLHVLQAHTETNLGWAMAEAGEWDRARPHLLAGLRQCFHLPSRRNRLFAVGAAAKCLRLKGHPLGQEVSSEWRAHVHPTEADTAPMTLMMIGAAPAAEAKASLVSIARKAARALRDA